MPRKALKSLMQTGKFYNDKYPHRGWKMIDGIKISYEILNFNSWKKMVNIEFGVTVLDTGQIKEKMRTFINSTQSTIIHTGPFETYSLMVKEVQRRQIGFKETSNFYLTISGSLHKNHFSGQNYLPFTWTQMQKEICHLEKCLHLKCADAKLLNLEVGINIVFPVPVFKFLEESLVSYKGKPFNRYNMDRKGVCLGYYCELTQYTVKIYDKGKQFKLPENLMRFELKFIKMQRLKDSGVITLADLKIKNRVNKLLRLLLNAWDNVLLYDATINLKNAALKDEEANLLSTGNNPRFWQQLQKINKRAFNYQRQKFKKLVAQHGSNIHFVIKNLIQAAWTEGF